MHLLLIAVVVVFALYTRFTRRSYETLAGVLAICAVAVCVMPIVSVAWHGLLFAWPHTKSVSIETRHGRAEAARPDIYYVILDGYSRADVLENVYGVDNGPFLAQLTSRGFYVADKSRPNYLQTLPSLAASLNGRYLDDLSMRYGRTDNRLPVTELVKNSWAMAYLRDRGYALINIASGVESTSPNPNVDRELDLGVIAFGEFETELLNLTPLSDILSRGGDETVANQRRRVLFEFSTLAAVPDLGRPRFVMCHIVSPHPPFVFDENGSVPNVPVQASINDGSHFKGTHEVYQRAYAAQVRFVNARLLEAIDAISQQPVRRIGRSSFSRAITEGDPSMIMSGWRTPSSGSERVS